MRQSYEAEESWGGCDVCRGEGCPGGGMQDIKVDSVRKFGRGEGWKGS